MLRMNMCGTANGVVKSGHNTYTHITSKKILMIKMNVFFLRLRFYQGVWDFPVLLTIG